MPYTIIGQVKKDQGKLFPEENASVFRLYFILMTHTNMDLAISPFTQRFHMYTESFPITDLILK